MSASMEVMPPGGHETYATSIFSKIKTYLDSKADTDDLAGEYSSDTTQLYRDGDLVYHDGDMYRCINGTSGGNWMPSFWQRTSVATELENKIEGLRVGGSSGGSYASEITTSIWFDPDQFNYLTYSHKVELNSNYDPSNKVNKTGDTMSGTLLRTTADGASWNAARDHALIRSHGFADNGSWFPALSFLTTGGSWAIGSLSGSNNFWFSYTRNNEYTNNINKTDNYQLVPVNDGNAHTYTIAHSGNVGTGDSNGQVKIAGTNVGVKGLGSAAYYDAASTNTASTVVLRDANRYIYAQYYNAGCGADNSATNGSYFIYSNSDGWIRKASRLNFAKALTDSHVTSPGFFVTLTGSWGSFGYSTASETRSAIGAMPVAGGTFTGAVAMKDSNIFRTRFISRNDTGDNGYMNHVNTGNSAYTPVRASAFTTMSCKHTKTNIVDISEEDALKLLDIRPVNFDYVEEVGGQKDQIGVLAEDTYEILPKVVSVPDDYVEEDFDISKGIHQPLPSVDYAKFVPYLIKLVQMQQKEIDILKEKISI